MTKSTTKKENPMTMISIRLPEDMVAELKETAPLVGETGYQPLIRSYIEQGLARDLTQLEKLNEVDYTKEMAKAEAARTKRGVSESRAEYVIDHPTEFVVGTPTEWRVAVEDKAAEKSWGTNLVALLNSFDETGWEDIGDPVAWVEESRKKRRETREAQK